MSRYHNKYSDYDPFADPTSVKRAHAAHLAEVEAWFAPHARTLYRLDTCDARAIYGWQLRTLASAVQTFGLQCPTGLVVTAAADHLEIDQELTPAYCAVREGERQRAALGGIAAYVAMDDGAWAALMEPIERVDVTGKAVVDTALLILLDQHYGRASEAFWQVINAWHEAQFGHGPAMTRAEFDICVSA